MHSRKDKTMTVNSFANTGENFHTATLGSKCDTIVSMISEFTKSSVALILRISVDLSAPCWAISHQCTTWFLIINPAFHQITMFAHPHPSSCCMQGHSVPDLSSTNSLVFPADIPNYLGRVGATSEY